MNMQSSDQEYGEFKGSTEATLRLILSEMKTMNTRMESLTIEVGNLKNFRSYILGGAAVLGFMSGFVREMIFKK